MASLATIRAAILAKAAGVADIGVANDYERYSKEQSEMKAQYVATISGVKQLRGWNIRRFNTREISPDLGRYIVTHAWDLRGYMALDDSAGSEKTFDNLVETLRDAFREDESLGGVVSTTVTDEAAGLQVIESGPVLFAGVLCHAARLRLFTVHQQ
jgi:hypothetical protein